MSLERFKTAAFLDQHYSIPLFSVLDVKLQTLKIILIADFFLRISFPQAGQINLDFSAYYSFFFLEFICWSVQRDLKKEKHGKVKAEAFSFHILCIEPSLLPQLNGEKPVLTSTSQGVF